jgi:hypothetical protein
MSNSRYIMPGTFPVEDENEDAREIQPEENSPPTKENTLEENIQLENPSPPEVEVKPNIETETDHVIDSQLRLPSPPAVTYVAIKPEALQAAQSEPLSTDLWVDFDGVHFTPPSMTAEEFHAQFDPHNEKYREVCGEVGLVPLAEGDWERRGRRRAGKLRQRW